MKEKKKIIGHVIAIGAIALLIVVFSLLKLNKEVSEYFFARGISRAWVFVFGKINGIFGFSVFGVFVILAIIAALAAIIAIIVLLAKKKGKKALLLLEKTALAALTVALVYVMTAGGCYNRKDMPLEKYEGEQLSVEDTVAILRGYYADFSAIADELSYDENGKSVAPYSFEELAEILKEEYSRLDDGYFSAYTPTAKKAIFSKILTYEGTCGITFQPLGEAVINYETPDCYLVVTAAHELAHAKGVMRERDANLLAYYLLITSDRPYLRYCGYMYSLGYLSSALAEADDIAYAETMKLYPQKAALDKRKEIEFWETKESFLNTVSDFFNDIYLKLSGVKEGTANYTDPSGVTQTPVIVEDENGSTVITVVKKISYSDTARVLISVGSKYLSDGE